MNWTCRCDNDSINDRIRIIIFCCNTTILARCERVEIIQHHHHLLTPESKEPNLSFKRSITSGKNWKSLALAGLYVYYPWIRSSIRHTCEKTFEHSQLRRICVSMGHSHSLGTYMDSCSMRLWRFFGHTTLASHQISIDEWHNGICFFTWLRLFRLHTQLNTCFKSSK